MIFISKEADFDIISLFYKMFANEIFRLYTVLSRNTSINIYVSSYH